MAAIIVSRLFVMQVVEDKYVMMANDQAIVRKVIYPARGIIVDRKGKSLLENKITLDLIEKWKTLEEIATIRELTSSTILSHLFKIYQLYPATDLSAFKPPQTILTLVQSVIDQAKKKGNTDENGYVRLKTIYDGLNGKLGYGEIKRCMIFL